MHKQNSNECYFLSEHTLAESVYDAEQEDREAAPNRNAANSAYHLSSNKAFPFRNFEPSDVSFVSHSSKKRADVFLDEVKMDVRGSEKFPVEAKWAKTRIPSLDNMEIRSLESPFNQFNAIVLSIPASETATDFVIAAFRSLYSVFQDMAPALTFRPNSKDLRCKGSYTEGFSTCRFVAQAWKVNNAPSSNQSKYILEFNRRSQRGREAFLGLKCLVANAFKRDGFATHYAHGGEIYPVQEFENDLGELSMPGFQRSSRSGYPITLKEEDVTDMSAIIAERKYPQSAETLELLARCCAGSDENREVLRTNSELAKAVHHELRTGYEANSCHHALSLIEQGATAPKDVLPAVARCLQVHSGDKRFAPKGARSRAIESTALRVMEKLVCQEGTTNQMVALRKIEEELSGNIRSEVFQRIQDIRVRQVVV